MGHDRVDPVQHPQRNRPVIVNVENVGLLQNAGDLFSPRAGGDDVEGEAPAVRVAVPLVYQPGVDRRVFPEGLPKLEGGGGQGRLAINGDLQSVSPRCDRAARWPAGCRLRSAVRCLPRPGGCHRSPGQRLRSGSGICAMFRALWPWPGPP